METRVKIGFFLDKKLMDKFRELIQNKYNKYEKGLLSYEAEMAFRHWLSLHTQAQNNLIEKKPNPTPKISIVMAQIKNYLLTKYYFELKPGQQVPTSHLKEAIESVRGNDARTVEKWMRSFHRMGLIKPITSATWEVI